MLSIDVIKMYNSPQISVSCCWLLSGSILLILGQTHASTATCYLKPQLELLVTLKLLILGQTYASTTCYLKPQLELLVTPPGENTLGNNIRIYWKFNKIYNDSWIGLYSNVPKTSYDEFLLAFTKVNKLRNIVTTKFQVKIGEISLKYDTQTYLGYTAVAWTNINGKYEAIVVTKLQTYPQWMKHYWRFVKSVPMAEIFLPGTHDTCSYRGKPPDQYSNSLPAKVSSIIKKLPLVNNWSLTQNRTTKDQLISGMRYLDVRVRKVADFYWVCHGKIIMNPLFEIVQEVIDFVMNTEKEIVFFDVHEFGLNLLFKKVGKSVTIIEEEGEGLIRKNEEEEDKEEEYKIEKGVELGEDLDPDEKQIISLLKAIKQEESVKLFNYLKQAFTINGKKLYVSPSEVPSLWKATPEEILEKGRVIISYIDEEFYKGDNLDIVWPPVHQFWGNKQKLDDLKDYIYSTVPNRKIGENSETLTAVMAELTATPWTVLGQPKNNLMAQAEANSDKIHDWFLDPAVALGTNVLAVDFYTILGVERLAFIWNERKFFNSSCDVLETVEDDYYQKVLIPN